MRTNDKKRPTYYDEFKNKGYTRRDFMKFCAVIAAYLGLETSGVAQISEALMTKPRVPVIWLHFQECTGCSESFIRSSHPIVADILLDKISLDYTETLMAASGHQAEASMKKTIEEYAGEYLLCVEGSIPTEENGVYCCIGGRSAMEILQTTAEKAKAVVCWGSCACNGNVQAAKPNPTKATPIHKLIRGVPIIKVPGCPPIGEAMAGVLVHLVTFDRIPELDRLGRPKAIYSKRVHDTCYRRPFYDAGLFVESFDDANAKKGYCLYKVGCKGPTTYNACGVMRWNEGVSFPIQSGHGCIGCSEENCWDHGCFYARIPDFPGFGIESNVDKVGAVLTGATAAGVVAHGVVSTIRRNRETKELLAKGRKAAEELENLNK